MEKKKRNAYNFRDMQTKAMYPSIKDFCKAIGQNRKSIAYYLKPEIKTPYKILIGGLEYEVITKERN